jgi:hypothetical protein
MRCLNKQPYFLCREEPTREYITVSMIILDIRLGEIAAHIDTESHLQFSCKHRETEILASFLPSAPSLASLHYPRFSAWSAFSLYKQKARESL